MQRRHAPIAVLFLSCVLCVACSRQPSDFKQIQRQRSGDYVVTLLSDSGELKQHSNRLLVEFRNASTNELANVGNVQIQASMVMPGMGPMFGTMSPPRQVAPGRYDVDADLGMAGRWTFIITFDSNQRVQFSLNAL